MEHPNEYFIIVSPPEQIQTSINFYKGLYKNNFGDAKFLKSRGHISFNKFKMFENREKFLRQALDNYFNQFKRFKVSISGFNKFEGSNTLYMKVSSEGLLNLNRHLIAILRSQVKLSPAQTKKISVPHLTIAKGNSLESLEKSWRLFRDISFESNFEVNKLTILKRRGDTDDRWKFAFEVFLN